MYLISEFGHLSECESGTKYRGIGRCIGIYKCRDRRMRKSDRAESMVDKFVWNEFEQWSEATLAPKGWSTGKYEIGQTDVVGLYLVYAIGLNNR